MMNEGKKSVHNVALLIPVLRLRQELMRMTMPDTHVFSDSSSTFLSISEILL